MRRNKRLFVLLFAVCSLFLLSLKPRQKAPTFALRDINSRTVYFNEHCGNPKLSKDVVIVDFFATWCKPCKRALGHLKKIISEYKDKVDVFLVSYREKTSKIKEFFGDNLPPFIIMPDPYGVISKKYEVNALPRTFIISGKDCRIVDIFYGEKKHYYEEVKKNIEKILSNTKKETQKK